MLLEKGANPDKPDNTGLTPLIVAIIQNKKDHGHKFVELLLQHNASLKDVKVNVEALKSINAENKYRGGKPEDDLLFQQFLNKMRGNNSYASEVTVSPIELAMAIGNQITKDMLASKRYFEQRLFSPRSLPLSTSIPVAPEALGKKLGSTGS
jgi:ankyrin repeat protein